ALVSRRARKYCRDAAMALRPPPRRLAWSCASLLGAILLGASWLVPAATIAAFVRPFQGSVDALLLAGARDFKLGFGALIVYAFALALVLRRVRQPRDVTRSSPMASPREIAALVGIVLVAAALRFHRLDGGPWLDEITSYVRYVRIPAAASFTTFDTQ